jgi:MtN3 and saliva related transmembrane protein
MYSQYLNSGREMKIMYLGLLAGFLTTSSAFPQLVKSYKTKSTKDLSFWFLAAIVLGVALWIVYGFAVSDVPVIVANCVSLLPLSCTFYLKLKCDRALSSPGHDEKKHMIDQFCRVMSISKPALYKYLEAEREADSKP